MQRTIPTTLNGGVGNSTSALAHSVLKTRFVTKLAGMTAFVLMIALGASAAVAVFHPGPAPRTDVYGDPLPDGALRRLGTLRFRHGGSIKTLLLTPDGTILVSRDYYGTQMVCVWELPTGKLLHRLPGTYEEKSIALSPDGKLLAVGQRKAIVLWDLISGKEVRRFAQTDTFGFAFSLDGKILAAGDVGPCIHLWDLVTGKEIAQLKGKRERISVDLLALTPDGKTLIAGDKWDSKLGLWDVASGKKRWDMDGKSGALFTIALSPDGTLLATGSRKGGIPLWNVKTGELVRQLGKDERRECYCVAFSPNGKTLAAIERDAKHQDLLCLWDVASGKELRQIKWDGGGWDVVFSRDGKTLIAAQNGTIRLLDAATGKEFGPTAGTSRYTNWATLSPDGQTLAYFHGNEIRLWDMTASREIGAIDRRFTPHGILSLAFSPDSRTLAASTSEYDIKLWDVRSRKLLRRLQRDKKDTPNAWWAAVGIAFAPDGKSLASANTGNPPIRLWDIATGKPVRQLTLSLPENPQNPWYPPDAVALSPDGRLLAASGRRQLGDSWVTMWEAATGKELPHLTRIINELAQKEEPPHSPAEMPKTMNPKVVFSPNGKMLVKRVRPKTIPIWETATGRQRLVLKGHEEATVCFAFAPDGRTLASASWDETIRLWDIDTGRELRKLTGHRGKANSLAFSADGKVLVSAGDDTTVLFWDVADVTQRKGPQAIALAEQEGQALWEDLAKDDAAKAYTAMIRLAAAGSTTIAAMRKQLRPLRPVEPERLARLLKELDSDDFAVREAAQRELEKLGDAALPAVRQTLTGAGLSLELRRRLEGLAVALDELSGERLRQVRAIEVLERIGTPDAREVLQALGRLANGRR